MTQPGEKRYNGRAYGIEASDQEENTMDSIALFGAAGKIGSRITAQLRRIEQFRVLFVEAGEAGLSRLKAMGIEPTPQDVAVREADVVVLGIPDTVIGKAAKQIVPQLKPDALVMVLDPAAPHGGELPERQDIGYFVAHPCHPPIFNDETEPEARNDFWGMKARQTVVCALMQGSEAHYRKGERIARLMFAPILRVHRVSVEQMAILEPAMAETVILTCMTVIKEAVEEAVERGVPREAAHDFAFGHMRVNLGILFGFIDAEVSAGAKMAVEMARKDVFRPDWKKVFEPEQVMRQVRSIVESRTTGCRDTGA